ncbi:hypothetical protein B0H14DRAFT_844643 [Mycena olivaceomarginata]|nr:hypothetical protein B0H14DRAFT_844643 [Mycena olivaceomarginata]
MRCSFYVIACVNQPPPRLPHRARHRGEPLQHADDPHFVAIGYGAAASPLCERLQALLALHGRHLRVSSATRMSAGIVPPTYAPSVFLSGRDGVDLPLSTPAPSAPLCFIATAWRARSSSCGSAGPALEMSAPRCCWAVGRARGRRVRRRGGCWRGGHRGSAWRTSPCSLTVRWRSGAGVCRGSTSTTRCGVELRLDNHGSPNCVLT